jgi:hypothetical protein
VLTRGKFRWRGQPSRPVAMLGGGGWRRAVTMVPRARTRGEGGGSGCGSPCGGGSPFYRIKRQSEASGPFNGRRQVRH